MKKVLASIIMVSYLVVSCGVVVNFHYCMDKLASVELFSAESSLCNKCGMHKKSHGCCRDEVKVVKLDLDQQTNQSEISFRAIPSNEAILLSVFLVKEETEIKSTLHWQNHSPPLLSKQNTYLLNAVFRI
jgi:hypothetical protein